MELIWISPGTFIMGSPTNEDGRFDCEGPQTQVTISKGFWIGKYEVTQGQYQQVMEKNPSQYDNGLDAPVENVNWNDANEFCSKLQMRLSAALRGGDVRLPTEAEWEYACRAGTTSNYVGELQELAWFNVNSGGTTHPVGKKQPNAWGLYDMYGNVWEWCKDYYAGKLPGGTATDPQGPSSGSARALRGGSWDGRAVYCRSAFRAGREPTLRRNNVGFRVVIEAIKASPAYQNSAVGRIDKPTPTPLLLDVLTTGTNTFARISVEGAQFKPLKAKELLYSDRDQYWWVDIPKSLEGMRFSKHNAAQAAIAQFKVISDGWVYMAVTSRSEGYRSGTATPVSDLVEQGWEKQANLDKLNDTALEWIVYSRFCKKGETFSYRTEKYSAPILITK